MNQTKLEQIAAWYAQTADNIYLYSREWKLLWKNRSCPALPSDAIPDIFQQAKLPCTVAIPHGGKLYTARLEQHALSEAPEEVYLLLRVSKTPWAEMQWQNTLWRQETENQAAAIRDQVFGISNAVSALYSMLEEAGDNCPDMLLQEEMEQLNIIKGNCCRLLRPPVCLFEIANYYTKTNISPEAIFLEQELSNLVSSCRMILGRRVRLQLDCPPHLFASVHPERFAYAMLYGIDLLCRKTSDVSRIKIQGKELSPGSAQITCTGYQEGADAAPARHSNFVPMYHTGLLSPEEQLLQLFCQTYGVSLLFSSTEEQQTYTLRFPPCQKPASLTLHSPKQSLQDDTFSLAQLVLADISDYRFY